MCATGRFRKKKIFFFSIDREIEGQDSDWSALIGDNEDNPEKKLIQKENGRRVRKIIRLPSRSNTGAAFCAEIHLR